MTLTEFLVARIAEDEMAARCWSAAYNNPGSHPGYHFEVLRRHRSEWPTLWRSLDEFTPARVLAECEAKRQIVEWLSSELFRTAHKDMLMVLAAVYADHPDYRDEWKP